MKTNQLFEEHEAIKASYSHYAADKPETPAVEIHIRGNSIQFQLKKLPNEIEFMLPDDHDLHDVIRKKFDTVRPHFDALKKKDPEAYERIHEKMFEKGEDHFEARLKAEVAEEFGELFEHLVTMLKARIVTFTHDYEKELEAHHAKHADDLIRQINSELSK